MDYTGFLQFWADSPPDRGGHNEHVGPAGFLNKYFPILLTFEDDGNWSLHVNNVLAGASTANGADRWGGESGAETTCPWRRMRCASDNQTREGYEPLVLTTKDPAKLVGTLAQFPPRGDLDQLQNPVDHRSGEPGRHRRDARELPVKVGGL